ncbi:MAG: branched-chain amino acid ABC transporter permease [Hyphomicrobiales bacterium]|nr:MAG: branched-chain amino acid ABC transporter permease [Hyphomicrobiales bacterium]
MSNKRNTILLVLLGAILFTMPLLLDAIGQSFLLGSATRILIYAIAAMSLNLILGYGGMVSFGHAAFFGVGAYVTGILSFHMFEDTTIFGLAGTNSAAIAWLASIAISALMALIIGALSLRTTGVYFIMITLAFAQMIYFLFVSLQRYGGDDGFMMFDGRSRIAGLELGDDISFYFVCLAALAIFAMGFKTLVNSRFGQVLKGCHENEPRMRALGCPTYRYKLVAFVIAGAGAGFAGALQANLTEFVSPDYVHWTRSGDLLIMVILGGIGTVLGPFFGAAAFLMLEEFLPIIFKGLGLPLLQEHWRVVFGPMLILIVLFAKKGLYASLMDWGRRKND